MSTVTTTEIAASAAVSDTIDARLYREGVLRMPAAWTAASLAFRVNHENTEQTVMQTTITGVATSVTQPGAATALEILQAAHVAADAGRGVVIEGSDGNGVATTETICLHATNTTTPVAGSVSFTKVSGVYTANGAVLGAQNVTVRAKSAGATVCTLVGATSHLGAGVPAQATEATGGATEMLVTGPNTDATFVTLVGTLAGVTVRQRLQLNAASPSSVYSTQWFDHLTRICVGEFTNAATGGVKTRDPWVPLEDAAGDLVELTVGGGEVVALPTELAGARYVRLWSETASVSVAQGAVRRFVVALKG